MHLRPLLLVVLLQAARLQVDAPLDVLELPPQRVPLYRQLLEPRHDLLVVIELGQDRVSRALAIEEKAVEGQERRATWPKRLWRLRCPSLFRVCSVSSTSSPFSRQLRLNTVQTPFSPLDSSRPIRANINRLRSQIGRSECMRRYTVATPSVSESASRHKAP